MARSENQKLKLLHLKELFETQSDEDHILSMQDIVSYLAARGIRAERKSVYGDISCLQEFGMDIVLQKGPGGGYFLASRPFELAELKLIFLSVPFQCGVYDAPEIRRTLPDPGDGVFHGIIIFQHHGDTVEGFYLFVMIECQQNCGKFQRLPAVIDDRRSEISTFYIFHQPCQRVIEMNGLCIRKGIGAPV